jgi:hypothetical protein
MLSRSARSVNNPSVLPSAKNPKNKTHWYGLLLVVSELGGLTCLQYSHRNP